MSELRKAAQMALEALNLASRNGTDGLKRYELKELDDTITALRAALAQPEPEPVAWWDGKDSVVFTHDEIYTPNWTDYWTQPLYAHPPQRNALPLSDDEIKCIKPICADFVSFRAGVRHAEREHGIGGEA